MTTTTSCRKCLGTGYLTYTHVDGGRCWACTGKADTSYTRRPRTAAEDILLGQVLAVGNSVARRLRRMGSAA